MIAKTAIAAALISLTTFAAVPAKADSLTIKLGFNGPGYGWSGPGYHHVLSHRLSTEQVRWMLRGAGYSDIRFVDGAGPVYQLRAHRHGVTYFLVVSARGGEILSRNRI